MNVIGLLDRPTSGEYFEGQELEQRENYRVPERIRLLIFNIFHAYIEPHGSPPSTGICI